MDTLPLAAAVVAAAPVKQFLQAILGEPSAEIGRYLGDFVREHRHKNLIAILQRAERRLADAGVSPQQVPPKIICPLLESGSLEEDLELQERWANLIANAAHPREQAEVLPLFGEILAGLTADQARFLDAYYAGGWEIDPAIVRTLLPESLLRSLYAEVNRLAPLPSWGYVERKRFGLALDQLSRAQLIVGYDLTVRASQHGPGAPEYASERKHSQTHLGISFVCACRPPSK